MKMPATNTPRRMRPKRRKSRHQKSLWKRPQPPSRKPCLHLHPARAIPRCVAVGVLLYLKTGTQNNLLYIFGGVIAAVVAFIVFKVFAEAAKLGADLGDMESRMIGLLFEFRDKLDNLK